jgi:hypothetical protein
MNPITPHGYRLGKRQEDFFVRLSPFDYMLTEVGRIRHLGHEYVVLRHDRTGALYARDINGFRLIRAYRTYALTTPTE